MSSTSDHGGGARLHLLAETLASAGNHRESDLDSLLPQGHPARLCRDCVGAENVGAEIIRVSRGAPSSIPIFALWLFAVSKGVGSAEELAWHCRNSAGFKWLAGGIEFDARALAAFRGIDPSGIDELLAHCLIAIKAAGQRGNGPDARADTQILAYLGQAIRHVALLRAKLGEPLGDRLRRRDELAQRRKIQREERACAVGSEFKRVSAARREQALAEQKVAEDKLAQQRQSEQKLAEQKKTEQVSSENRDSSSQPRAAPPQVVQQRVHGEQQANRRFVSLTSLAWEITDGSDARFKRILYATLTVFALLSAALLFIKPPPVERLAEEKIPQRLTKLFEEQRIKPKVEKPKLVDLPKPKEQLLPKDIKTTEAPTEIKPVESTKPIKAPPAGSIKSGKPLPEEVAEARVRASQSGLVAMRDQLAALRDISSGESLRQAQTVVGAGGTQRQVERDLIGQVATSGSGGVATKQIAHAGGGTLQGRTTTKVAGPVGAPTIAEVEKESKGGKRTAEEIKLAFDANKSAIYGIYRRALRENPLLEGRVVLKLTIEPSGQVTACSMVSSTLKDPDVEAKLMARVQLINFGTRPKLETWTGTYQIEFVPSL